MLIALVTAAALAGLAGSWSPCGLSMVETLDRARWGIVTFAVGALAGGALTFGGLAWLGSQLFGPVVALAVAILVVCALGDAAGRRIVPQVRRQVPESWRRILPVPAASALYGVLLGLGFTTFLLSYATWALAIACLAVGRTETGLLVGIAFAAGRAVPVAVYSLRADGAVAIASRPDVLRGLRGAAAVALLAAAVVLAAAPPAARAASTAAKAAYDPSASGNLLAYQPASGNGVLVRGSAAPVALPGTHPAVSGDEVAWLQNGQIVIADAATLAPVLFVPAPGADAITLSATHVAWRVGDQLLAVDRTTPAEPQAIAKGQVGRPSLRGRRVVFDIQTRKSSRIRSQDLVAGTGRTLRSTVDAQVLSPTLTDRGLLYVRSSFRRQQLVLGNRVLYATTPTARRDKGYEDGHHPHHQGYPDGKRPKLPPRPPAGLTVTLLSTALGAGGAYVTWVRNLPSGRVTSKILRVGA